MTRRIISIITALALCWSLCPTWAFSYEGEWEPDTGTDTGLCAHHTEHTDACGYIAPSEGQPCNHEHMEDCYTIAEDGSEVLDCQHTHDSECGYTQATPGASCGYECPLCPIEDLIAALPRALTEDNAETVRWQLDEILDLYQDLSWDEQEQIDLSPCWDLQAALDEANAPTPVDGEGTEAGKVSAAYQEAFWNESTREVIYSSKTAENCTPVADSTEVVTWDVGWYVVNSSSVTISEPITVNGAVNLILANGCTLTAEQGIVVTENNSLSIYAQAGGTGTLNATGRYDTSGMNASASAGIGGGTTSSTADSGVITIHGGLIYATGGNGDDSFSGVSAAGIGGGTHSTGNGGSGGTIIIYGGTVTAGSSLAHRTGAGIGGGAGNSDGGDSGNITIYGGTVTATSSDGMRSGAGIGGGAGNSDGGDSGNITIYGGTVTATSSGSVSGAGIGGGASNGGDGGKGSNIEIYGGSVNATGGFRGAGIGGGGANNKDKVSGDGTNITISGGEVTAIGGTFAAGIGGGGGQSNSNTSITGGTGTEISIEGGIVDAKGGTNGDPIGNGGNASGGAGVTRTSGIIFENGEGKVYGTVALDGEYDVPAGYTLTYAEGGKFNGNYAFYQNGSPIEMDTVKAYGVTGPATVQECTHPGVKASPNDNGTHTLKCPYCRYNEAAATNCSYGTEYQYDDTDHWQTCEVCGYKNKKAHDWTFIDDSIGNGSVTENYQECIYCEHTKDHLTLTITVPTGLTYGNTGGKQVTYTLSPEKPCDKVTWKFTSGDLLEFADGVLPADLPAGKHQFRVAGLMSDETIVFSGSTYITVNPAPLTGDMVTLSTESVTYSGTEQKPTITVKQGNNALAEGADYDVSYSPADFTNAGTVKITVTGKGNYTGTVEKTYTIAKATLTADGTHTASGIYGAKLSALTIDALTAKLGETPVPGTWKLTGDTIPNVGDSGEYTATFTPASGADNYEPLTAQVTLTISKAAFTPQTGTLNIQNRQERSYTFNLAQLLPTLASGQTFGGNVTYTLGAVNITEADYYTDGAKINDSTLTLPIQKVETDTEGQIGTITVTISCNNFNDTTATINVRRINQEPVTISGVSAQNGTYNGEAHNGYQGIPQAAPYNGTFKFQYTGRNGTSYNSESAPVNAGDYTVTITLADTDDYIGSLALDFKIEKASITIRAEDKSATVGEGIPALTCKISGLVSGESLATEPTLTCDADISKAGSYPITASGAAVPNTGNYNEQITYQPGTLTVTVPTPSVVNVTSVTLNKSTLTLPVGGSERLTATVRPSNADNKNVSWSSSDTSVATVNSSGTVTGVRAGTATITVTTADGAKKAICTVTVSLEKVTPELTLSANPSTLKGGGTVTLTLSGLPVGGSVTVTCPGGISVTKGTGDTWTATLPNSAATYIFTAHYDGSDSYNPASASCSVTVSKAIDLPDPPSGDELRLTVEEGITEVPEGLKNIPELNTPEKLIEAMKKAVLNISSGIQEANTAVYDVELLVSEDGGKTWEPATLKSFPAGGLIITLPYPKGTDASYRFTVVHMFTTSGSGHNPGETETPTVTNTADGIRFTVSGLSPISVGWTKDSGNPSTPTNPSRPSSSSGGGGGGSHVSTYAITVEKAEHGKVTSNRTNAASGSTVTLTATPDSGHVLDTLTVIDSRGNEIKLTAQSGGKYTFTMPSRAVTVRATFAPLPADVEQSCDGGASCPSHGFTDLGTVGTWYHEAVDYVLRHGLMGGYGNGLFGPDNRLTRAQLVQILYNAAGKPSANSSNFSDVPSNMWCADAIGWAASQGIVNGYSGGIFGPDDLITREQLAVMLWRYAGNPAATRKELHFTDADKIGGYALDALRWATELGVVNGYSNGELYPKGFATRAQAAQMIMNFLKDQ